MTTTTAAPAATASFFARNRALMLIGLGLILAVGIALASRNAYSVTPMDPGNAQPDGTRAVAQVLEDEGVDVTTVRSADDLEDVPVGSDTTVVVVLPELLSAATAQRLDDHTGGAGHIVVVGAGIGATELFGVPDPPSTEQLRDGYAAGCVDPMFDGLTLEVDSALVYAGGDCFPGELGSVVLRPTDQLMLFGADQALTNDQVLRADNAAIALRLLGQDERVVWYVPSYLDVSAGEGVSLRSELPRWVFPGLWLVALVMAAVIVWRARRLGALASEPLPVVVRAVETTRSLGRLYRRAGDRGHAAASLRRSARAKCAERLRLGSRIDTATLVREVARRTGRPVDEIARLLDPPPGDPGPGSDKDLIMLAQELAALDREVRST